MSRPLVATIDLDALGANLRLVRQWAPGQQVWAVVKADAYGHGLYRSLPGLAQADGFALVEFDRAVRVRQAYPEHPILLLEGAFDQHSTSLAVEHGFELSVHDEQQICWLETLPGPRTLKVWLKFNSGMNRLGFTQAAFRLAFERLVACSVVDRIGLMAHFANADVPGGIDDALNRFERATDAIPGQRSLANSAAIHDDRTHVGWVRPGIALYGASPFADRSARSLGLVAVMRLESKLIGVQSLLPGDCVGYGSIFRAGRPMRIGIVACGYGDGYPRSAPTGTPIWVGGKRTRIVGRVSMDMLTVDLDPVPEAGVGSPVQLWGDKISVDDVAQSAGTIGYELLCRLAPRVPVRVHGSATVNP
ncbi:MAG: alanine racemase [Burkholderiaceae bacterium]